VRLRRQLERRGLSMAIIVGMVGWAIALLMNSAAHAEKNIPFLVAQTENSMQQNQNERPTDLNKYSLQFWPRNSLRKGQVVSTDTPYGRLTCRSTGSNSPRDCSISQR
jgi:hypothetical protein